MVFGIVVMVTHDISDFSLNFAKFCRDLKVTNDKILDMLYANIVVTWFYFRVFVAFFSTIPYSMTILQSTQGLYDKKNLSEHGLFLGNFRGMTYLPALLSVLAVMNVYWCYQAIVLGLNRNKNGEYVSEWEGEKSNKSVASKNSISDRSIKKEK